MEQSSLKAVVPDGGWGWVVVGAVALINMTNQSILSVFGLLFGGELKAMEHGTFTAALITNLNSLALNFSGLFIGPIIKMFKPRNVAALGCVLVSFGMFLCTFATKGWHFIIAYSVFVGLGLGLIAPSTFIAINSYFTTKRGRAVGVSLAGAGLGQIFVPHLVRIFLDHYGFRSAVLAMSVLSLTGMFGALLLKPLKSPKGHNNHQHIAPLLETRSKHCDDVDLNDKVYNDTVVNTHNSQDSSTDLKLCSKVCQRMAQAMDLELLQDPVFWNIIIGMALVYTSTINFTMLYPTFLQYSIGLSSSNTASCMSVVAGADIVCRLLLPCITDKLRIPYRVVFLLGTIGLLISRAALAETTDFSSIIVMSVFTGMTKSATVLNNNLTISDHCRPEKLPGGLGLNMFSKGILVITVGQLLGFVRDYTKSYVLCLHAQNILLLLVILTWTPEMYYRFGRKQEESDQNHKRTDTMKTKAKPVEMVADSTVEECAKISPC